MHFTIIFFVRASGEANLGTLKYVSMHGTIKFVRATGETILGTLKCCSMHVTIIFVSRLRRGIFRYTKICVPKRSYLGLLFNRRFEPGTTPPATRRNVGVFCYHSEISQKQKFRASGEAILGTLK